MSDFDKLKDDAEREAQQHPEQVKEGEQAAEKDLGLQQHDQAQQDQDNTGSQEQGHADQDQHNTGGANHQDSAS
jgi:hypothetical protein